MTQTHPEVFLMCLCVTTSHEVIRIEKSQHKIVENVRPVFLGAPASARLTDLTAEAADIDWPVPPYNNVLWYTTSGYNFISQDIWDYIDETCGDGVLRACIQEASSISSQISDTIW